MKNGLNGATKGSNGISLAHKGSLLDYVKTNGKVKNEPVSPVKKIKKRVSFGPSTVKIFSELDYFSGEKAMLQEIARKQRIRDIKKSLRNNHKKDDNVVTVKGRRSSFCQAKTQIRQQSPIKNKKTTLKKPLNLHSPNHVENNVSEKDKKEQTSTKSGKDDGKSNEKNQRDQTVHLTEQSEIPKKHQDGTKDKAKHSDTSKSQSSDGRDSHQESGTLSVSGNSFQDRRDDATQKMPAQGSDKPLNDSTTSTNKVCNSYKTSLVMVRLQKVTMSQCNDACKVLADLPSKAIVERKEEAPQLPSTLSTAEEAPQLPSTPSTVLSKKRTRGRPRKEFRQERVRKYSSRGRPRKGSVPELKFCTSLNESSSVCLKTEVKQCPSRPCLSRLCKEDKDKTQSAAEENCKTSDMTSKNPKDVSQLAPKSSVNKIHSKSTSLGKRVSSKPSDPCKKIPGKKISPKTSKHCQKKAATSSKSSKKNDTKDKGNARKTTQKADRKRKAPETAKLGVKAKKAKYKEKSQKTTLQKKKKEEDPDWKMNSKKNAKKLIKKTPKKLKKVKKSHIAALRDKAKVEKILKSYVEAYKQGKKNLLYKLLKNGLHLNNKKLNKGLCLKDKKLLKNGLLLANKKKAKVVKKTK
ncbi:triadin-like isoform X2 [Macrobrachium nipponense]